MPAWGSWQDDLITQPTGGLVLDLLLLLIIALIILSVAGGALVSPLVLLLLIVVVLLFVGPYRGRRSHL
jgi:ABC-type bacteriocin/lantibiotic exporter with double-glycine peptidase domain